MSARNPALWADIARDLETARSSAERAAFRVQSLSVEAQMMDAETRFDRERAVGSLVHDCYTALEAALERLIDAVDGDRPKGGDYHAQLIERAAAALAGLRPAIVSAETARDLHALRGFRHVMRHAYGGFDYARAAPNAEIAARAVPCVSEEVTAFARAMGILPN